MAISRSISALIRAIAGDRRPGSCLFVLTAEETSAEADVQTGDTIVFAQAAAEPGEAVVWSSQNGQRHLGRAEKSGQVRAGGKLQRPAKVRGVLVAAVSEIKPGTGGRPRE